MLKVLFLCIHNSTRSQMAETYVNEIGKDKFIAESAGIHELTKESKINPYVVKVMKEEGFDIENNPLNSAFDLLREGRKYDIVVTVWDDATGQQCPVFPSAMTTLNWSLEDPSSFTGTEEEVLEKTREVREKIKERILQFVEVFNIQKLS